ncbi:MAG: hypothetical protein H6613_20605 [Ignavibacteriales bacterium]|nr:hypothetical protein [Ignavibacteriales bacterium]
MKVEPEIIIKGSESTIYYTDPRDFVLIEEKILLLDGFSPFIKTINLGDLSIEQEFGQEGKGPGEFLIPTRIKIDQNDNLIVYDVRRRSLTRFTKNGVFVNSLIHSKIISDFDVDVKNNYVLLTKEGLSIKSGNSLIKITVLLGDTEIILDSLRVKEKLFIKEPSPVFANIPYAGALFLAVLPNKTILSLSSKEYKFTIFDKEYKKTKEYVHKSDKIVLSRKDEEDFFNKQIFINPAGEKTTGTPQYIKDKIDFPKYKDYVSGLFVDKHNKVIVVKTNLVEDGYRYIDFFNFNLNFIKRSKIKDSAMQVPVFYNGGYYQLEKTEDDYINLVNYNLK